MSRRAMTPVATIRPAELTDRETIASRLLRASVEHTCDPDIEIDWAAPVLDGVFAMQPHRMSLYGTALWDTLSHEQRVELSKHEICSIASVGIWFELILMQLLVRHSYDRDPTQAHVQYALTEIGDECRHSVMFAKMISKYGVPAYGPRRGAHELGRLMKTVAAGPSQFAAILVAEEILDTVQREGMRDESLQPLTRTVNRIHVAEEARHVRYAREEVLRQLEGISRPRIEWERYVTARVAFVITRSLVHPDVYAAVGLDPREARRAALANPHYQQTLRWAAARLVDFLAGIGMLGGPSKALWRKAFLLP